MGLLRLLEEEAAAHGFQRIRKVYLAVGALAAVDPEAMRRAFEIAARGTLADGTDLAIAVEKAEGRCPECGGTFETTAYVADCPRCPDRPLAVSGGRDLRVIELEVD